MSSERTSTAIWDNLPPITDRIALTKKSLSETPQQKRGSKFNQSHFALLKPVHEHMPTIEGKRAMLIMDNCVSKVLIVSTFPQIASNLPYYEFLLGTEVNLLFKEYESASVEYESMIKKRPGKRRVDCNTLNEIKERINHLTRQITRCIIAEPNVAEALIQHYREWEVEPHGVIRELTSYLVQLRFILRQALLVSPRETVARDEYIDWAQRQEARQTVALQRLEQQLKSMTLEHSKVVDKKIREIEKLTSRLLATEDEAAKKIAEMRDKFIKEHKEARNKHKKTMMMLTEESAAAKKQCKEEIDTFREREMVIRRQKWRLEDQLDTLIKKMDAELFELQSKYDKTKKEFDEESRAFEYLNSKFQPLKKQYDEIMEVKRKEDEAKLQAIKEQDELVRSATFITSLYRAYKARLRIRSEYRGRKFQP